MLEKIKTIIKKTNIFSFVLGIIITLSNIISGQTVGIIIGVYLILSSILDNLFKNNKIYKYISLIICIILIILAIITIII